MKFYIIYLFHKKLLVIFSDLWCLDSVSLTPWVGGITHFQNFDSSKAFTVKKFSGLWMYSVVEGLTGTSKALDSIPSTWRVREKRRKGGEKGNKNVFHEVKICFYCESLRNIIVIEGNWDFQKIIWPESLGLIHSVPKGYLLCKLQERHQNCFHCLSKLSWTEQKDPIKEGKNRTFYVIYFLGLQ